MVWSITSSKGRRKLSKDAAKSRESAARRSAAWIAIILYNLTGFADIYSTSYAIANGLGAEANPIIRAAMEYSGHGWILAKLLLQGVVSAMVLWFPHWIVLGFFALAALGNAWVVHNNLMIAGLI